MWKVLPELSQEMGVCCSEVGLMKVLVRSHLDGCFSRRHLLFSSVDKSFRVMSLVPKSVLVGHLNSAIVIDQRAQLKLCYLTLG
jgi:hypothetical protein